MADAKLSALSSTCTLGTDGYLYAVLNDPSSPLSRKIARDDVWETFPNRVTEGANEGTGIEVFREKSATSLTFRSIAGGKDISISSAASLITVANAASVGAVTFTVGASNTWNNELIPVWQGPRAGSYTLVELNATASGVASSASLSFNLQRRDFGAINSAGVDIFTASQVGTTTGLSQTSFSTSVIAAKNHLMFTTGSGAESGSVNYFSVTLYYTK